MKLLGSFFISLSLLFVASTAFLVPLRVQAADECASIADGSERSKCEACVGSGGIYEGGDCKSADGNDLGNMLKNITNIIIFIVGAVAVLMLIIGGLRYVLSGGDSAGVEGAKNTILYAIIGIIVAFMAYAIVNFVLTSLAE